MRKFLTARWQDLIMVNYEVEPSLLAAYVPSGTELDLHEGRCFVSLVGFMFLDTRVLGLRVPFHINFEEVNFRFYVKRELADEVRSGVCFLKEIVTRRAICYVARIFYGEPYESWLMASTKTEQEISYSWARGDCQNYINAQIGESLGIPVKTSHGEFILEHYWGYTKRGENRTDEYWVEHPPWDLLSVTGFEIAVDFGKTYGEKFAFLSDQKPYSVLVSKGSEIVVYQGEKIG